MREASGGHEGHLRSELPTKVPQTRSRESFRFQEPVLRPRAEVHGESTYDSVFSQNLTILEKLDVEWPAVEGVLELEGELRFNLFCFDGGSSVFNFFDQSIVADACISGFFFVDCICLPRSTFSPVASEVDTLLNSRFHRYRDHRFLNVSG